MADRELRGRQREIAVLDGLINAARAGRSEVLVVRGEAGVGKSALLESLVARSCTYRIARAAGVESEMELAYAGLHQLCQPFLDRIVRLPRPQHDALGTAFGMEAGPAPDRFLVGLAVLNLLADAAAERPVLYDRLRDHPGTTDQSFDPARIGLDHIAFQIPSRSELEAWHAGLVAERVTCSEIEVSPFGLHLNLKDPDNIAIELFAPEPA